MSLDVTQCWFILESKGLKITPTGRDIAQIAMAALISIIGTGLTMTDGIGGIHTGDRIIAIHGGGTTTGIGEAIAVEQDIKSQDTLRNACALQPLFSLVGR